MNSSRYGVAVTYVWITNHPKTWCFVEQFIGPSSSVGCMSSAGQMLLGVHLCEMVARWKSSGD